MRIAIHGMRPSGQLRCPALLLQRSHCRVRDGIGRARPASEAQKQNPQSYDWGFWDEAPGSDLLSHGL